VGAGERCRRFAVERDPARLRQRRHYLLQRQFRLFYALNKPVGVVLWAKVNDEVAGRLAAGTTRLRPQDWNCGDQLWVVEVISPFGAPEVMVRDFKEHVFPDRDVHYLAITTDGKKEVKVV